MQYKLPLINPPFNYSGSKFKLLSQLFPHFDYSKNTLVDLFTGGGSIYTNSLENYDKIIANDILKDLIGLHEVILESDDIINETKKLATNSNERKVFDALRNSYNNEKTVAKFYALILSTNNNAIRHNASGKFNASYGKRTFNENTEKKLNAYKSYIRKYKDKITFINKNYYDVEINKDSFYYIDPPYSNSNIGYNLQWKQGEDDRLFEYCENIYKAGGTFMVSGLLIHNGYESRLVNLLKAKSYKYKMIPIISNYNGISKIGLKETKEVIIINY